MDFNTILVITIDGGLVLFFLYALYTIRSPILAPQRIKKDLKFSIQDPVVTPLLGTNKVEYEVPKLNSRELFELEQLEPVPRDYVPSEYEPKPAEPATEEFELPVFEPESTSVQTQKDTLLKEKNREREH